MKKIRHILIILTSLCVLGGCFNTNSSNNNKEKNTDIDERTPCEKNGHIGTHYLAHDMPNMTDTTTNGVNEYWECDYCNEHFLNVDDIEATWVDSNDHKSYSSFEPNDDRLLKLPTNSLDSETYNVVLDANDVSSVKKIDISVKTINSIKPVYDDEYGACLSFKYNVESDQFEFQTNTIYLENPREIGEIFTYFYNPFGYKSKISVLIGNELLMNDVDFVVGWNKLSFSQVDKINGESLKFKVKAYIGDKNYNIKISSFYSVLLQNFEFDEQYIDLNISETGSIDQNNQVKINIIDNPKISAITSISFNDLEISTNEYVKTRFFGLNSGEHTLHIKYISSGIEYETNYKVILCSKILYTKEDLNSFPKIAGALGDSSKLKYGGYFALNNDIDYNGDWTSFISRNSFNDKWENQFDGDLGFNGTFDGRGHVIKNLCVSSKKTGDQNGNSFIYKLGKNGTINNLGFIGASMYGCGSFVTSIGEGTISNVYVEYDNKTTNCDGLGTFFYYDRSNDLGTLDKSYTSSEKLKIENCFVNGLNLSNSLSNIHVIGSKKYGKVLMRNVFALSPNLFIEDAIKTESFNAGSFVCSSSDDISKNASVINDIKQYFNSSIFNRDDVIVPREKIDSSSIDHFIDDGKSNYAIYFDDYANEESLKAVSFLVEKINEFSSAQLYVSNNEIPKNLTDKSIVISSDSTLKKLEYTINISNGKVQMTYASSSQTRSLVLTFLREIFGFKIFNFDLEKYNSSNNKIIDLIDLNKVYKSSANDVVNYGYYQDNKRYEAGYNAVNDELISVVSNDGSNRSGQYHNLFYFLPPEVYYNEHPKWFTPNMNSYGGYFNPPSGMPWSYSNLCFNAQGSQTELKNMQDVFYSRLKETLLNNPTKNKICIGVVDNDHTHNDIYCTCDACSKQANANISVIKFLNEMSRRIKADPVFAGRDIYLYTMAYRALENAPDSNVIKCDENVGVWIAPINANYAFPLNDKDNNAYTYNNIENWKKVAKHIGFYLYDTNYTRPLGTFYCFESLIENHKYLSSIGTDFIFYCDLMFNESSTGFGAFKNFILRQTIINANLKYEQLYEEFFSANGYYGAAGPRLKYYYDELMKAVKEVGISKFGEVYNSHIFSDLGNYIGSMTYWKQYSIDEAYDELNINDPNYEIYKKHILTESITLRLTKFLKTGQWFDGDSEEKFIADCNSVGIYYIQEGIELNHSSLMSHKNNL